MPVLNYTTTIAVAKTAGEIQGMLGRHGASAVAIRYENKQAVGVSFTLRGPHGDRAFTLPVDVDAMHKVLLGEFKAKQIQRRHSERDQAARTAWRVVKDWIAAQLALVEAQMASMDQVMLPYLNVDGQTTLYEAYRERELKALPSGK